MDFAKEKINLLYEEIEKHNHNYYDLDNPTISDFEFDKLLQELEQLEKEFPQYKKENSPTEKVGGAVNSSFEKVPHSVQLASLQDVFDFEGVTDFLQKYENESFLVEPKIDGLSVSLIYENGKFIQGSTRGDGFIGEDITQNLQTIKNVPKKINYNSSLEVRGEVYMSKNVFNNHIKNGEDFANPRNAAAGSLRQKDAKITKERQLDILIFDILQISENFETDSQQLDFLQNLGFKTVEYSLTTDSTKILDFINDLDKKREDFPFEIDGACVKINSLTLRKELGSTSKYPKWAIAYKYPPEEKETLLKEIELNVGRTGNITPVAVFEPIFLAGTTVSRASLHNFEYLESKNIQIGDTVIVRKAGEIIPEVLKSVKKSPDNIPYSAPENCPVCDSKLTKNGAFLQCMNPNCSAKLTFGLVYFAKSMRIDGLGEATANLFVEKELVKSYTDLYTIELKNIEFMGKKSASNLLNAIEKSKNEPIERLIMGLGLPNIGEQQAKILVKKFKTLDKFKNLSYNELITINGMGVVIAADLEKITATPEFCAIIDKFIELNVGVAKETNLNSEIFTGKTFVVTGTLPTLKREAAEEIIEQNGGKVSGSVSKKTDFLLAGEKAGSKLEKAVQLNITIISENDLLEMLK